MSDSDRDHVDTTGDESTNEKDEGSTILEDGGVDTDERAGRSLGIEPDKEPDEETKEEIEEEREKRLDPDNRPDGAEVDNTDRDFDVDHGMFKDSDDYDESEEAPYTDPEDPNSSATSDVEDDSDSDEDSDADEDSSKEPAS
jgi:hypothetical protein